MDKRFLIATVSVLALALLACNGEKPAPGPEDIPSDFAGTPDGTPPQSQEMPPRPDPQKFANPAMMGGGGAGPMQAMGRIPNPLKDGVQYKEATEEEIRSLVDELSRGYTDQQRSAMTVARELMQIGPKAVPLLEEALEHEKPQVREMATFILVNMMSVESASRIAKLLDDEDHDVKINAARGLGGLKCKEAVEALLAHVDMKDTHPRFFVLNSLGMQEDPAALPALGRIAVEDELAPIRRSAIYAIGQIKDPEGLKYLVACKDDPDKDVRVNVYRAMGEIGGQEALPYLLEGLKDTFGMARREAILGLNTVGGDEVVAALSEHLKTEKKIEAVHASVWTIGQLGDESNVPVMKPYLTHHDVRLRETALRAVHALLKAPHYTEVMDLLKSDDASMRIFATWLISRDGSEDKENIPPLSELVKDEDPQVRLAAVQALGSFRDRTLCPLYEDILKTEKDPGVLSKAVEMSMLYLTKYVAYLGGDEATRSKEEIRMLYLKEEDLLLPHYIALLLDEDLRMRRLASAAIELAAGDTLGYAFDADEEARLAGQKKVQAWYDERKALGPDPWIRKSVEEAIGKLEVDDPVERQVWAEALRSVTGQPFRLGLDASPAEVKSTIQKWKDWWAENGSRNRIEWLMDAMADPARPLEERMALFFDAFWFYTSERFGVTPNDSPEQKLAAIEAMQEWWKQNKDRYVAKEAR